MRRGLLSVVVLLFSLPAFVQDLAVKNVAPPAHKAPEDSAQIISQWMEEARLLEKKDTARADRLYLRASNAAIRRRLPELDAAICMQFAGFLFERNLYHRSFANYLRAKNIYTERGEQRLMAKATIGVAISQYYRGNYRFAIRNFVEAITLAEQLNMPDVEAESSEYLGLLYNAFQQFATSTQYFRRSMAIKNKTGDSKGMIRNAAKLSEIYYNSKRYDSAYYFASIAYEGAEQLGLKTDMNNALLSKASSLVRLKKWNEALSQLKQVEQLSAKRANDVNLRIRYLVLMGNYYLSQNNTAAGKIWYDSALNKASQTAFPEQFAFAYHNISDSYFELNDFKSAYQYQQLYVNSLGEMMSGENVKNLGNMEVILGADQSKDEIKLLNAENQLKQVQLLRELDARLGLERENDLMDSIIGQEKNLSEALGSRREALERENRYKTLQLENERRLREAEAVKHKDEKRLRLSLLAGLGLALLLGAVIFYQYNRQRRKNRIIEKQSEDLEVLMKEIHHRVKNNLQVVSSLLNLQSHYIKDREAVEAVKDSRNRVLSMALIHQSLYQEGDLQSVDVPDYIDKLCSSLFVSYNISPERIRLEKNIQPLLLNLETLIPVGLILNELMTNSLKYAFPDGHTGTVRIQLKEEDRQLVLQVRDDGIGLPGDFSLENKSSFGFKMIHSFLQKLKGSIDVYTDGGTVALVRIKNYKTGA